MQQIGIGTALYNRKQKAAGGRAAAGRPGEARAGAPLWGAAMMRSIMACGRTLTRKVSISLELFSAMAQVATLCP